MAYASAPIAFNQVAFAFPGISNYHVNFYCVNLLQDCTAHSVRMNDSAIVRIVGPINIDRGDSASTPIIWRVSSRATM